MKEKVHVAIIGAGSAGLAAMRRVREDTDDYIIVDDGPLGTKCARTGCMPSKALISVARDYHRRHLYDSEGIRGADRLRADVPAAMRHVRKLRDHFASRMAEITKRLATDHLIRGTARITAPNHISIGDKQIECDKMIIATGARPKVPDAWKKFGNRILTSDTIFEQEDLPQRIAVIGMGPIGLELGQSLSRLGVEIVGFDMNEFIGGITDPDINASALDLLQKEFPIHLGVGIELLDDDQGFLVKHPNLDLIVDSVIVATGIEPDLRELGLENLGVPVDERGMLPIDANTMRIADLPVFIAGDADSCRPILHEALDDGFIAGRNSSSSKVECFCRRMPLAIVFSDPEIATVGLSYEQLKIRKRSFVTGKVDFSQQSRAILEMRNEGLLHVYINKANARILGAELICPDGEHLAHLLALAVQQELSLFDALQMPFYHPTIEEALRTALQGTAKQLSNRLESPTLSLCDNCPESPLC